VKALVIVDMQRDFMPGGPLATPKGDELVPLINKLMEAFPVVLATKDWHPKDHVSFADNHPGKKPGETVMAHDIEQILWPTHCVQGTTGADFVEGLNEKKIEAIFEKGVDPEVDSYSTFFDNAKLRDTGLDAYLRKRGVDSVTLVGIATDYCVLFSALDACRLGWDVTVITDATRPINLDEKDEERALDKMQKAGVHLTTSEEVLT